jgi:hypothetical protein
MIYTITITIPDALFRDFSKHFSSISEPYQMPVLQSMLSNYRLFDSRKIAISYFNGAHHISGSFNHRANVDDQYALYRKMTDNGRFVNDCDVFVEYSGEYQVWSIHDHKLDRHTLVPVHDYIVSSGRHHYIHCSI